MKFSTLFWLRSRLRHPGAPIPRSRSAPQLENSRHQIILSLTLLADLEHVTLSPSAPKPVTMCGLRSVPAECSAIPVAGSRDSRQAAALFTSIPIFRAGKCPFPLSDRTQ